MGDDDLLKKFGSFVDMLTDIVDGKKPVETHVLKLTISSGLRSSLERIAREDGCSVAKVISAALANYRITREESRDGTE